MQYRIIVALPGRPPCAAWLTTDSSNSSYGLPVVVVDGQAYGAAEVLWIDGSTRARKAAEKAGYKTLSDADSRWDLMADVLFAERAAAGGRRTARGMSAAARKNRARKAARARWGK